MLYTDLLTLAVPPTLQATATVTNGNTNNVSDGNTLKVGSKTYRFKTTPVAINDVKIGADADTSFANLVAAINGTGTPGTEYFTGTTANADVTSSAVVTHVITLTAIPVGFLGNTIALVAVGTYITVSGSTLSGGIGGSLENATLDDDIAYTTDPVDVSHYNEAIAYLLIRSHVGATGTLDIKFQLSHDLKNWIDAGDAFVQVTTADSLTIKKLTANFGKYLRAIVTLGGTAPEYVIDLKVAAKG